MIYLYIINFYLICLYYSLNKRKSIRVIIKNNYFKKNLYNIYLLYLSTVSDLGRSK